jgi:hypothetical protein
MRILKELKLSVGLPIALSAAGNDGHAERHTQAASGVRLAGSNIEREASMHIHANNNLLLASIGAGREELSEIQAKRAAEVRKKLASASRLADDSDSEDLLDPVPHGERRAYDSESQAGEDEPFGHRFSAKA